MRYPAVLHQGATIGVCAPSSGVTEKLHPRLDKALLNVEALGYKVIETESVRNRVKGVSADSKTRAKEFMSLYENPYASAIIPPWGGEFLMDMLPYLDFEKISAAPPKWVCGYSDLTTLLFPLTILCDMATIHGSNLMNMGFTSIHASDLRIFEAMSKHETVQCNSDFWGRFIDFDNIANEAYHLDQKTEIKALRGGQRLCFEGRMIGGCMDVLCKLIGTRFAPLAAFQEKYKQDGFIWTLESCEMSAADIYRTLWQMRECGWFAYCSGVICGRPDGYSDKMGFTLADALEQGLGELNIPVLYGADIGHIPPQMQVIIGAYGEVEYENGRIVVRQAQRI